MRREDEVGLVQPEQHVALPWRLAQRHLVHEGDGGAGQPLHRLGGGGGGVLGPWMGEARPAHLRLQRIAVEGEDAVV